MRTVAAVTTSRADYGIYLPVFRALQQADGVRLELLVSGSHLSTRAGLAVDAIVADGFAIGARVETLLSTDTPAAVAKAMGLGLIGFGQRFAEHRPDLLLVLGDRFEMYAAALAALPFRIPVAHLHGGELTEGAFDDALRHSLTKLSHLHFVATEEYARRVRQLGEEAWRVTVSGAPSLDHLRSLPLLSSEEIERRFGLRLKAPFALITFLPETLADTDAGLQFELLLDAIDGFGLPALVTAPNADPGGDAIRSAIARRAKGNANLQTVETLGTQGYFSVMALASVMLGNSSSGLIEAASFRLPVVNVGSRQAGRLRPRNVVDVPLTAEAIRGALTAVLAPAFRDELAGLTNPYGDGHAAERILARLCEVPLGPGLIGKRFVDAVG